MTIGCVYVIGQPYDVKGGELKSDFEKRKFDVPEDYKVIDVEDAFK